MFIYYMIQQLHLINNNKSFKHAVKGQTYNINQQYVSEVLCLIFDTHAKQYCFKQINFWKKNIKSDCKRIFFKVMSSLKLNRS